MSLPTASEPPRPDAPPPSPPPAPGPLQVLGPVRFRPLASVVAFAAALLALESLGFVRSLLSFQLGVRLDRAELLSTILAASLCGLGGWLAATLTKRVAFGEVVAGVVLAAGAGYVHLHLDPGIAGSVFAIVPEGAVAFAPALVGLGLLLAAGLGGTVAHMLGAGSRLDLRFRYESFIARAHLRLTKALVAGILLLAVAPLPGVVLISLAIPGWPTVLGVVAAVLGVLAGPVVIAAHMRGQRRSPTLIMTVLSIGGVATGVMALVVVLSVMSGFEQDLKKKILGTNAHAIVIKYGSFDEWQETAETVRQTPGVRGVSPFVLNEVMVTTETNLAGVLIKGIDPDVVGQVTELPQEIREGKLSWLKDHQQIPVSPQFDRPRQDEEGGTDLGQALEELDRKRREGEGLQQAPPPPPNELPGIVIGRELARQLKVFVGDPVTMVSPIAGELGPMGPQPKSMQFRVAGVFYSGMYEYDSKFAYIALDRAQSFFKMGRSVTGLELKVTDIDDARRISRSVLAKLEGYPYHVKDWGEMNRNLFSALKLEKVVMAVILAFIILVACFNILSTLVMLVLEKSKEISILKSMGSRDASVMKIFVLEGLAIGVLGTMVGLLLGLQVCWIVGSGLIPLDPEVYYIPYLPVRIDGAQFALVGITAVILAYVATIFPALYASRLPPVEGLRNE